jgi:Transposase, Mutator family
VVRSTMEETLNALLDAEAERLCRAERCERSEARKDTRAGSYQLQTIAGEVALKVPELRTLPFETAIIERYRRRESSEEEAREEMYLAGVSVRRVEGITEALWGTRVSPSTGQRAEPEALRADRELAHPADRGQPQVCVFGWVVAEAKLGRRSAQRVAAGGDWRE